MSRPSVCHKRKRVSFGETERIPDDQRDDWSGDVKKKELWYTKKELRMIEGENSRTAVMYTHSYRPQGGFNWISDHDTDHDIMLDGFNKGQTFRGLERFSLSRRMSRKQFFKTLVDLQRKGEIHDIKAAEQFLASTLKSAVEEAICVGLKDAYFALRVHQEQQTIVTDWGIDLDESLRGYLERPMVGPGTVRRNSRIESLRKSLKRESQQRRGSIFGRKCRLESFSSEVDRLIKTA